MAAGAMSMVHGVWLLSVTIMAHVNRLLLLFGEPLIDILPCRTTPNRTSLVALRWI